MVVFGFVELNCEANMPMSTLPKTNSSPPKNGWLEDDPFPFGMDYFQGRTVSFRDCNFCH